MQLGYASEAEDALGRAWRKQHKLAAQLGAEDDTDTHPPRPKGMHQRTYRQALERIWTCEMWRDEQLYLFMLRHGFCAGEQLALTFSQSLCNRLGNTRG
jgi:hypothetical protein